LVRDRLTDAEWAIFAPFLTEQSARGGHPLRPHRFQLSRLRPARLHPLMDQVRPRGL